MAVLKGQTTSFAPTINYYHGLKEELKTLTSSTPINNHCYSLREGLKTVTSSTPINNYYYSFKKGLETLTSFIPINNHHYGLKKRLEIQRIYTISTSFVSSFNILKVILSNIELAKTGYTFWYGYC